VGRRRQRSSRVGVVVDPVFYKDWSNARPYCMACGIPARKMPFPGASVHHIVKFRRSDEPTNLLKMCGVCHDSAEGIERIGPFGIPWPLLPLGVCLSIKAAREPADFDIDRLRVLYGFGLPEMLPIPPEVEASWRRWRIK
jgi:hypothetical protein